MRLKTRQPLGGANVCGIEGEQCERLELKFQEHMRDELNVDWVRVAIEMLFGDDYFDIKAKLDFKKVGPRLRHLTKSTATALAERSMERQGYLLKYDLRGEL